MQKPSWTVGFFLCGLAILALVASLSACTKTPLSTSTETAGTGTPSPEALSGKVNVIIQEYAFHPDRITIKAGTTVNWINRDPVFYSIRSDSGSFQSNMLAIGQLFSFTFNDPGSYPYYCEGRGGPGGEGMSGVITVVP